MQKQIDSNHLNIALIDWSKGIGEAIKLELINLGHTVRFHELTRDIPDDVDLAFTFGPYGAIDKVINNLEQMKSKIRPKYLHWSTQGMPNLGIPTFFVKNISILRSLFGQLKYSKMPVIKSFTRTAFFEFLNSKMSRFYFVGLYLHAHKSGILDLFADTSKIYAERYTKIGIPTFVIPYGSSPLWGHDLNIKRDIDVLWMGRMVTKRREKILKRVRSNLEKNGVTIYFADNKERPFIYNKKRTEIINRSKITINVTSAGFDDNLLRFFLTARNKSLIVSEKVLPHCELWKSGTHYVSSNSDDLEEKIIFFLQNYEQEALPIIDRAYQLVTTELSMHQSIKSMMDNLIIIKEQQTPTYSSQDIN